MLFSPHLRVIFLPSVDEGGPIQNKGRSPAVEVMDAVAALSEGGSAARPGLMRPSTTEQARGPAPFV